MSKLFNDAALTILLGLTLSSPAPGALSIISGTLHASASDGSTTNTPPDLSVGVNGGSLSGAIGNGTTVNVSNSITPFPSVNTLYVDVEPHISPNCSTSANGTASLSESKAELVNVDYYVAPTGLGSSDDSFDLKLIANPSNLTVLEVTQSTPGTFGPFLLGVGTYTLTWTEHDIATSPSGAYNNRFQFFMSGPIPEPGSVGWALAGACAIIARPGGHRRASWRIYHPCLI